MDFELDLSSENMTSFLELEQEIKEATTNLPEHLLRPSVIVKPRAKPAAQPSLTDIMTSCGIEYELPVVDENQHQEELSLTGLNNPLSSSLVTPDGQNVIIIIAPSSPTESVTTTTTSSSDSDPEWTPSPAPLSPAQLSVLKTKPEQTKARKKYARSKPPTPPSVAPYPADKKERKKAQNRTAAFRYREKKKSEQDLAEE